MKLLLFYDGIIFIEKTLKNRERQRKRERTKMNNSAGLKITHTQVYSNNKLTGKDTKRTVSLVIGIKK